MFQDDVYSDLNLNNLSCFEKLKREILHGNYAPGEKLSMDKLKNDLGLGQSQIREALNRLLCKGLVQVEENKGYRVSAISEEDFSDLCHTILQIEHIALRQSLKLGDDKWEINLVA